MGLLSLFRQSFAHGVHPAHNKGQTADLAIQRVPFGHRYVMPLGQHIGAPAIAVVKKGQSVKRGEMIAKPGGFISTALHSPVTGTVSEISPQRTLDGSFKPAIVIEADPFSTQRVETTPPPSWETISLDDFIELVQQAGVVGMGGAAFPSHVKYSIPDGIVIDDLLINGAECEPFLTNDHRLMVEQPEKVINGTEILRQKLGAKRANIGVEKNKPEAIVNLQKALDKNPELPITITPLEVKYPQGAEKMLIQSVYHKEVPAGQLPRDIGVAVNNSGTVVAIADLFATGSPLIERVVTVSGPGIDQPANLLVPLGTPVRDVLKFCGGLNDKTREVIMGGPMMGFPIASLDVPILKGSSAILAFTEQETARPHEYPCIRCGRCLEACPYFLNPSRLALLSRNRRYEETIDYHVMDCVECGACSFACPSNIPIVQLIRTAKDNMRQHPVEEAA
ncbi:MAG: electron transport complex subunit RsxC [Gammaproteobacteria bacterium]|uniref:Ion-translocating oxidoreductase complex subunit C n=1 Tax=Candidatus Thiopontia autotrophica TaxID=2841688 RepID=A0A8J6P724_9GAMM|nr:electron transport complex subunit RsxC [Candidatus Thiopontia autotrophica]MBL6968660.1 electron transport complex subunit RsxC [Gammaproteobacteria bacterium]